MIKTFKLRSGNRLTLKYAPGLWLAMNWENQNPSEEDYAEYWANVHKWVRKVLPRNREFTIGVVTEFTRAHTRKELTDLLGGSVPVGPVQTAADIFADPHVAARNMLPEVELPGDNEPVQLPGTPIRFTGTPAGIHRRPPKLDEHLAAILRELGLEAPDE